MSPVIDGDLVIVSRPDLELGNDGARPQRFVAMDKRTGDIV